MLHVSLQAYTRETTVCETVPRAQMAPDRDSVGNAIYELQQFAKRHGIKVMFDIRRETNSGGYEVKFSCIEQ